MKCGKCGAELEADSRFCTGCGAPVAASPAAPAATPTPAPPAAPAPAAAAPVAAAKPAGGKKGCACAFTGIGCIVLLVAGLVLLAGAILFFRADLENLANQFLAEQTISQSAPAPATAASSSPSAPATAASPPGRAGNLDLYAGNWSVVNPNEGSNPNENVLIFWTEGSGLRGRDGGNNTTWSLQPAGDGGFAGAMTDPDGAQVPVRVSLQADLNYLTVVFAPPNSEHVSVVFERIQ